MDPFRVSGLVAWRLRYDVIAIPLVAAAMVALSTAFPLDGAAAVVPLLGVVVSIFIGFRNSTAFNRWWEARTLWGNVIANCRAFSNAAVALDDGSPEMAVTLDRMRRRQVRHAWQLAAELRGDPVPSSVNELTPEDPADGTAGDLLTLQAADVRDLVHDDMLDRQGRVILTNLNSAQATAAAGLERIRDQPLPRYYVYFVRALAWLFAILVCTRVDAGGHHSLQGVLIGVLIMALFVIAERMGHLAETPLGKDAFALPMNQFCTTITTELLGSTAETKVRQP